MVIGCYTAKGGIGLRLATRDLDTGALRAYGEPVPTPEPSFVARHPNRSILYAVNELVDGTVSAFRLTPDARLVPLGRWSTGGAEPCHAAVTPDGAELLVANYGGGSVARLALDADGVPTGRLGLVEHAGAGPHPERQLGPHAHQVVVLDGRVLAVDLGADAILAHDPAPAGPSPSTAPAAGPSAAGPSAAGSSTVVAALPAGTGPRHLARAGGLTYVVGELTGTVTVLDPDWGEVGTVAASRGGAGNFPAGIAASADGRFLYVSNRGPDTVSVFALGDKLPTPVGEVPTGGAWPRHFALAEPYLYVANERSDTVVVFRLDDVTGLPVPTGSVLATPSPTCVVPL
jgi:6-phosphogluconolactonase (cycloisomerase 2 family)